MENLLSMGYEQFKNTMLYVISEIMEEMGDLKGEKILRKKSETEHVECIRFLYETKENAFQKLLPEYKNMETLSWALYEQSLKDEAECLKEMYVTKTEAELNEIYNKHLLENKEEDDDSFYKIYNEKIIMAITMLEYYVVAYMGMSQVENIEKCYANLQRGYNYSKGKIDSENWQKARLRYTREVEVKTKENQNKKRQKLLKSKQFPLELKAYMDEYVVGQETMKKKLSMLVSDYLKGNETKSILMVGDTGSGKNHIFNTLKEHPLLKEELTFFVYDCSELTPNGFQGKSVVDALRQFKKEAERKSSPPYRGVILWDEFSKIVMSSHSSEGDDVNALVQYQLLSVLSGTVIEGVDTSKILFIFGSCFEELNELRATRKNNRSAGFTTNALERKREKEALVEYHSLRDDLLEIGMKREFLGRISAIVEMEKLNEEHLKEILVHKNGVLAKKQNEFDLYEMNLIFPDEVVDMVVKNAVKNNLGARSVINTVEEMIGNYKFDMIANGYKTLLMHPDVLYGEEPIFERS